MFSSVHTLSSNGLKFATQQCYICVSLNLKLNLFRCGTTITIQASERVSRLGVVVVLLAAAVAPEEGIPGGGVHRRRRREGDTQEQLRGAQGEGRTAGISNILSDILLKEVLQTFFMDGP